MGIVIAKPFLSEAAFLARYAQDKISSAWKSDVTSIHTAYHFFF
jgi:hypothetical protein